MQVTRWAPVFVFALIVVATGCQPPADPTVTKKLAEIDELQKSLSSLTDRLDAVDTRLSGAEFRVGSLEQSYFTATFDPASAKGYSRIDTTTGTFLVSIQNVAPYVDGFKVTCNFGNPSSATYAGFKLKAKWGARFDAKAKGVTYDQWQSTLHEKEITLMEQLRAGAWNPVSFVVSPAKADEFGYLELSMTTDHVSLTK